MGLNPGKKPKNLSDMSSVPDSEYRTPPVEECEEFEYPFIVDDQLNGTYRMRHYNDKIVDFAICLMHDEMTAREDRNIVRSDCEHSCVHRHAYRRDGTDILKGHRGKGVKPIPPAPDGYSVVHMHYDQEYDWVYGGAQQHYQRWRRS